MKIKNQISQNRLKKEVEKYEFYKNINQNYKTHDFDNIKTKNTYLLNNIDKSNISKLYSGLTKLIEAESTNDKDLIELKKNIYEFESTQDKNNSTFLCSVKPLNDKLNHHIDNLEFHIYNYSKETLALVINIKYSKALIKQFDDFIANKHNYGYPKYIGENIIISDLNIEIKDRVQKLISRYLPLLSTELKTKPVSLNIYYLPSSKETDFINLKTGTISIEQKELNNNNTIYFKYKKIDTHNNASTLIIDEEEIQFQINDLRNIFGYIIEKNTIDDMIEKLKNGRTSFSVLTRKQRNINRNYRIIQKLEERVIKYKSIIEERYEYPKLKTKLKPLNEQNEKNFILRLKDYDTLLASFTNSMTINSYKTAFYLTMTSIILFLISMIINLIRK